MVKAYRKKAEPLGDAVAVALTAVCRKRGFATAALTLHWTDIVGAATAARAQPDRLVWPHRDGGPDSPPGGATLVVRADPMAAIVLQHEAPRILERINQVFGWRAVERLKVTQLHRPVIRPAAQVAPPAATDADRAKAQAFVDAAGRTGTPAGLAAALVRLGANIEARLRSVAGDVGTD